VGDIVNLRNERKRVKRRQAEDKAAANRVLHGLSKAERALAEAKRDQSVRLVDGHRIDKTEGDR
jgi:hypothetical protein